MNDRLSPGYHRHENRKVFDIRGECVHTETGELYVAYVAPYGAFPALLEKKERFLRCPIDTVLDDIWPPSAATTPGIYQHEEDGHLYWVYGEFVEAQTGEIHVCYRDLWNDFTMMVRSKKMFFEIIDRPERNYHGPRFWLKRAF